MKTVFKVFLAVMALFAVSPPRALEAQTTTTWTTTTAAVLGGAANTVIPITASTGITASTASAQQFCVLDHETVTVRAINSLNLTVVRAAGGVAEPHASGVVIMCGPTGNFQPNTGNAYGVFIGTNRPVGACTAANQQYLPVVSAGGPPADWALYNCNQGQWQRQLLPNDSVPTYTRYCTPAGLAALALLSTNGDSAAPLVVGNNTTPVAGSVYYGTIEIPRTMVIKGISMLNGTVASTDDVYFGLFRDDVTVGTRLASTLLTGTAASGIGRFQDVDLTAQYLVTGPARYWISYTSEGTTTRFRTISLTPGASTAGLGAFIGALGSSTTGTAPALANLVLPTSLVANVAPIGCVYQP